MSYLDKYEVLEDRTLADVSSRAMILRHKKTGARAAILSNQDDNKVFYIGFRTTPEDETGVPHIIEHTTLCGSEKYPVKDPFIELAKGSLNTFLNAMTYPDKTVYPLASYNDYDFKNLMDVYLDAVFHPNITKYREIFKQEGWHYELEDAENPITISGVVYNEMKGAYSSPEEVLQSAVYRSLFPDNTYSRDSGGNPEHIPELTYEAYLEFYHKYYHPSNSYIYLYGDMDVEERLDYIDREYLSKYDYLYVDSAIETQKAFEKPVEYTVDYAVSEDDPTENAAYLSYSYVVGDSLDPILYQVFSALDYALVSAPGAPVRKALIDAGIGEDVYGRYEGGVKQPVFSIVSKNANESDKEAFAAVIRETLEQQVRDGIDRDALLAAINSDEFRFREADFGMFPKGLLYGLQCLDSWIFDDRSPFIHLECLHTYAKLREYLDSGFFEELVQKYLLDNTHASLVAVRPCPGKNEAEEEQLAAKLEAYKNSLTQEEIRTLIEETASLQVYQETPSSDEDLAKIPMLGREDLKKEAMEISNNACTVAGARAFRHDCDSNGIAYITFLFDIEDTPVEDVAYAGILAMVHGLVDTKGYTYQALSNAIDIYTGGISEAIGLYNDAKDPDRFTMKYEVTVKVLAENLAKACELADEIMFSTNYDDVERLKKLIAQTKARLQVRLSSSGHATASSRAMSYFSRNSFYSDLLHGVDYYRAVCRTEKLLQEQPEIVVAKLRELRDRFFAKNRLTVSFTGNESLFGSCLPVLTQFVERIPEESPMGQIPEIALTKKNEGFADGSQIQYVAKGGNFVKRGYGYTGTLRLLRQILSLDYLWNTVRVKNGAYGVMTNFLRNGDAYFVSYRDPRLQKTLKAYDGIVGYLEKFDPDERDMTKYVIGTFGAIDTPMNPEAKGRRSMRAYFEHVDYEMIQKERDQIRKAKPEDIRALAGLVRAVLEEDAVCVVGNEAKLKKTGTMLYTIRKLYNKD